MKLKEPVKRNPVKTKANILKHATLAFAKAGYHGTALDDILAKAKVNKRMVYHYFGNKLGLYREVHLEGWKELQAWFAKELVSSPVFSNPNMQGSALLREALKIFYDFMAGHQIFVRLLVWDGLEGGKISRSLWKDIRGPIYYQIEQLVMASQLEGALWADLKPDHLIITFMGAVSFYFSHAQTMIDIFHKNPLSEEAVRERRQQLMATFEKLFTSRAVV